MKVQAFDPTCCPLCGQPNQCGQCEPQGAEQPCWCFSAIIAPDARQRIPSEARNKACLCARCARGESSSDS
ncbi:cysteine-rich CWC family protein [Stutzerimonas nitrititolerans]|uniref:cysteine-rich CWC family protein n=1 Tax=Stutzerimonas nitrititolerans TaxID=2482751 RepID=UPI0028A05671|nr:cysteine-rich CWC family protein [Stutzerimonas nitrititolerans]